MAGNQPDLSILLKWIVDRASTQQAQKSAEDVATSIQKTDKAVASAGASYDELGEDFLKFTQQYKQGTQANRKETESFAQAVDRTAKSIQADLASIQAPFEKQIKTLKHAQHEWMNLHKASMFMGDIGRTLTVAGGAIIAPLALAARSYMANTKENTQLTREWKSATDSIQGSYSRVGKVAAQEILPFLRTAASVMDSVSQFVQKNPGAIGAALKVGGILVGLGVIATAVSKGIALVAGVGYITLTAQLSLAMRSYQATTREFIAGVYAFATAKDKAVLDAALSRNGLVPASTATGIAGTIGQVTLIATSVLIGAELGLALGNKIGEFISGGKTGRAGPGGFGLGDVAVGTAMLFQSPFFQAAQGWNKIGVLSDQGLEKFSNFLTAVDKTAAGLLGANKILTMLNSYSPEKQGLRAQSVSSLSGSSFGKYESEILKAYMKMVEGNKASAKQLASDISDANKQAASDSQAAWQKYSEAVASINQRANSAAIKITQDYQKADARAEQEFLRSRAQIVRDGGIEIQRIEQENLKRLAELRYDHDRKMYDLASARDALGLVQEQRDFEHARQEQLNNTNEEIAQRRQDLAIRLRDQAAQFAAESAQRYEDYQARLKENAERRAEELAQQAKAYAEERKQIAKQREDKIRDLREEARVETEHRRAAYLAAVRNLDIELHGEQIIKNSYYSKMLEDALLFAKKYRATMPSGSTIQGTGTATAVPVHDFTGYAGPGLWQMAKSGQREYVLSGQDTRAMENAMGGQLSRQMVMNRIVNGGKQAVYNDYRVISTDVSAETRRALQQDAIDAMNYVLTPEGA